MVWVLRVQLFGFVVFSLLPQMYFQFCSRSNSYMCALLVRCMRIKSIVGMLYTYFKNSIHVDFYHMT